MTATTLFRLDARVVACDFCGAPLEIRAASGRAPCRYCGVEQEVPRRGGDAPPAAPRLPEAERLARLRAQDGRRAPPAPSVSGLAPAGQLLPWKAPEALSLWQAARRELRAGAGPDVAERLCFLAVALAAHHGDARDPLRERAVLETSLEALALPRHRRILRAALARSACRDGDLAAAEAWLAGCDPASDDLAADSAYRFARACIDTARGALPRVIEVLGAGPGDVPIADELDPPCAVLRANALEKTGRLDRAVDVLAAFKQAAGGIARHEAARFVERHPALRLCEASEPAAEARHRAAALGAIEATAGRPWILLAIAAVAAAVTAGLVYFQVAHASRAPGVGILPMWVLVMGLMPLLFGMLGVGSLREARRARRLRVEGTPVPAQILRVTPTGTATMGVPELRYHVLVLHGQAPYEASVVLHASAALRARLRPSSLGLVRVDRADPSSIHLETD